MKKIVTYCIVFLFVLAVEFPANAQTVKFEETFDVAPAPSGWLVVNNDGSPNAIHGGTSHTTETSWHYISGLTFADPPVSVDPEAGSFFWWSSFEHANASGLIDEWLISPQIAGIEIGDSLCFFAGAVDVGFNDSLRVFISTTGNAVNDFTSRIGYFKLNGPIGAYTKYSFDLSPFAGNDIIVAVNYFIVNGGPTGNQSDNVWVDHFSVVNHAVTRIDEEVALPGKFALEQNYPNPFNPSTKITFALPRSVDVTLKVYNTLGQEVTVLLNKKYFPAGRHAFTFNMGVLTNGIYYYKIEAGTFSQIMKMTLLK